MTALRVLIAVAPRDGEHMGNLPDEHEQEERPRREAVEAARGASPCGGPSDEGRERAGDGADERGDGRDRLEERVPGEVDDCCRERDERGDGVRADGEDRAAEHGERDAEEPRERGCDAARGERAAGGAGHGGVAADLHDLIEDIGTGCGEDRSDHAGETDEEQILAAPRGGDAPERESDAGGDGNHLDDAGLGEVDEVGAHRDRGGLCGRNRCDAGVSAHAYLKEGVLRVDPHGFLPDGTGVIVASSEDQGAGTRRSTKTGKWSEGNSEAAKRSAFWGDR